MVGVVANDNLSKAEQSAVRPRTLMPRSGRRFPPAEVRAAGRRLRAIGGAILVLWLVLIIAHLLG